jgi:hypothetical protein
VDVHTELRVRLATTDTSGIPISSVNTGAEFVLSVFVEDVRDDPSGVFSIYMDVIYDQALATPRDPIAFGPSYSTFPDGLNKLQTPGLIDEVGSIAGFTPLGGGEFLVFSVTFTAGDTPGVLEIVGDPADLPADDVLFFEPPESVSDGVIDYGSVSIEIGSVPAAPLAASAIFAPLSASAGMELHGPVPNLAITSAAVADAAFADVENEASEPGRELFGPVWPDSLSYLADDDAIAEVPWTDADAWALI